MNKGCFNCGGYKPFLINNIAKPTRYLCEECGAQLCPHCRGPVVNGHQPYGPGPRDFLMVDYCARGCGYRNSSP